jgi:signal transduction histidine kinase
MSAEAYAPFEENTVTDEHEIELGRRYQLLLNAHLAGAGETALADAYHAGRAALGNGVGVLDLVTLYLSAAERALAAGTDRAHTASVLTAVKSLLLESLSPFEMAHRLYRESNTALRLLNDALEEQSRRIARTLHDNTNQLVASLGLAIAAIEQEPGAKRARLAEMRTALEQISDELRRVSHDLRPPALDELGVIPALEHFAHCLFGLTDVDVRFLGSTGGRLPPSVETVLFRVAQEALSNVARHAKAHHAAISFQRFDSRVTCTIYDDGRGFDSATLAKRADRGLGLITIRERLDALGGKLDVRSTRNTGTTVTATVPLGGSHADPGPARR